MAGVQFQLDGANLGAEDTTRARTRSRGTRRRPQRRHTLTAVARDAAGNTTTSATVTVTVVEHGATAGGPVAASASTSRRDDRDRRLGNGNAGTLAGPTLDRRGRFGGAITFDGVNDLVTVPDANSLDLTTAMTLEAWVRPTAVGNTSDRHGQGEAATCVYALYASSPRRSGA